jgi:hypothetical protein
MVRIAAAELVFLVNADEYFVSAALILLLHYYSDTEKGLR